MGHILTYQMNIQSNIILTDSDFILTNRTCAIAITADMSFRTALAADFKIEYKNVELHWKQRPGIGPNRGRLHPRELYALVHVIFSDTNIQVYLHKMYYLNIG